MNEESMEPTGPKGPTEPSEPIEPMATADPDVELFEDLGRFESGSAPVDAVLRRGRKIRVRRRALGGSALAATAALAIAIPVAISGGPSTVYGSPTGGGRVTVNPTTLTGQKGRFSGTVDGKKWSVDFDNQHCYYILWSCGFSALYPWDKYGTLAANASDNEPDNYTLFLDKGVSSATVILQNGEVLHLEAVPVVNLSVALFALPHEVGVSKIELFDAHGTEIAYSFPFTVKGHASAGGTWYKPTEQAPAEAGSVELTHGTFSGQPWTITAYVGPSGVCIVSGQPECGMDRPITGSTKNSSVATGPDGKPAPSGGDAAAGLVGPNIDHMQLDYADGTKVPITIKSLGGYRFFAYIVPPGKNLTGVTAFDRAGKPLPAEKNS